MSGFLRTQVQQFRKLSQVSKRAGLGTTLAILLLATVAPSPVHAATARIVDALGVLENIIKLLAPAAAIAFLIMILVGAFKFITSGGDPKAAASARSTLTYAILGVILVAAAYLILRLLGTIIGSSLTEVNIT